MSTVVVGGAGFIGRRLVRLLVEQGEDVLCIDLSPEATAFASLGDSVRTVRADVGNFDELIAAIATADEARRVVNLAYSVGSHYRPHAAFRLNVLGMENVFEASRLLGIDRVVFASSLAVSGPQRHFGERPVTEDDHRYARNQYAAHKIFNESQAEDYREKYGMEITAIRPANVCGTDKVVGSLDHVHCVTGAARGERVILPYRDLMRCPVHVDDVAEVFARVVLKDKPEHHVYNTGGTPVSLGDIAAIVQGYLPDAHIEFEHEVGGRDAANVPLMDCYLIDNQRIRDEFQVEYPPYAERVRQMIDEVRSAEGLAPVSG